MELDIKKLILGDCEITEAVCQVIADIVKVKDTIEELDLPKNTKSSKKYKIAVDESAETVEKTETTIKNIVMYHHDEATHPDEVVDEMILQTDVDDTQCSEQIVDVPVPQIVDRIVEVVTAFHWSESQGESLHRSSTCQDTHTK